MESVQVAVRIRPDEVGHGSDRSNSDGLNLEGSCIIRSNPSLITVVGPKGRKGALQGHDFSFDSVFDGDAGQVEIFELVKPLVDATIEGFTTTVFAYGPTGSGKTHTISGHAEDPGVLPRTVNRLFEKLEADAAMGHDRAFMVFLTYVEIYNNTFNNLLGGAQEIKVNGSWQGSSSTPSSKIEIREHPNRGVYLSGGHNLRVPVTSATEVMALVSKGMKERATSATQLNERSSRSHAILTLEIEANAGLGKTTSSRPQISSRRTSIADHVCMGKMQLIDLAGSERLSMSGAEGSALVEAQNINLSLSLLGDVLSALSKYHRAVSTGKADPSQRPFIPYRNSKLTHLLKDSLGGNCKTLMICTIRAAPPFFQQTMMSLRYAGRAKDIKNIPHRVVDHDPYGKGNDGPSLRGTVEEIERLKRLLEERAKEFERLKEEALSGTSEAAGLKVQLGLLQEKNAVEKAQMDRLLKSVIHSQEGELEKQKADYGELQNTMDSYSRKIQNQRSQIKSLAGEVEKTRQQADLAQSRLDDFSEQLRIALGDNEHLKAENKALRERCGDDPVDAKGAEREKSSIETYRRALKKMAKEREKLKNLLQETSLREQSLPPPPLPSDDIRASSGGHAEDLIGECDALRNKVQALSVECETSQRALRRMEAEHDLMQSSAEAQDKTILSLQRELQLVKSSLEGELTKRGVETAEIKKTDEKWRAAIQEEQRQRLSAHQTALTSLNRLGEELGKERTHSQELLRIADESRNEVARVTMKLREAIASRDEALEASLRLEFHLKEAVTAQQACEVRAKGYERHIDALGEESLRINARSSALEEAEKAAKTELKQALSHAESAHAELQCTQEELAAERAHVTKLKSSESALSLALQAKEIEAEALKRSLEESERIAGNESEQFAVRLADLSTKYAALKMDRHHVKEKCCALDTELERERSESRLLKSKLLAISQELAERSAACETVRDHASNEAKRLASMLHDVQLENSEKMQELSLALRSKEDLETLRQQEMEAAHSDMKLRTTEVQTLREELAFSRTEVIPRLESQLQEMAVVHSAQKAQLETLLYQLDESQSMLSVKSAELDKAQSELMDQGRLLAAKNIEMADFQSRANVLSTRITDLTKESADSREANEELRIERSRLIRGVENGGLKLKAKSTEVESLSLALADAVTAAATRSLELDNARRQVGELERSLERQGLQHTEEAKRWNQELSQLRQELESGKAQTALLQEELAVASPQAAHLAEEVTYLKKVSAEAGVETETVRRKYLELEEELDGVRDIKKRYIERDDSSAERVQALLHELNSERIARNGQQAALDDALLRAEDMESRIRDYEISVQSLEKARSAKAREADELRNVVQELRLAKGKAESDKVAYERLYAQEKDRTDQLEDDNARLKDGQSKRSSRSPPSSLRMEQGPDA